MKRWVSTRNRAEAHSDAKGELYRRAVTGVIIIATVTFCILSGAVAFLFLNTTLGVAGLLEFYRLHGLRRNTMRVTTALALAFALFICAFWYTSLHHAGAYLLILVPATSLIFLTVFVTASSRPFEETAMLFLGHIYVILPLVLFYLAAFAKNSTFHYEIALGCFMLLWANDTGAYAVGKLIGRHPLAPAISPNKTWEGSVGGALLTFILAYIGSRVYSLWPLGEWMLLGLIVIVFGTAGDLLKSRMKRARNVKDCGKILPGHGGVLDRFDSLLGSAPFVFMFLSLHP